MLKLDSEMITKKMFHLISLFASLKA